MYVLIRDEHNPLITPRRDHAWESLSSYNPSVIYVKDAVHLYYRALAHPDVLATPYAGRSSIGRARSFDREHFEKREQVIVPEEVWETLGCEDPRATIFERKLYILYTAVEAYNAGGIRAAMAVSHDFETFNEKHLLTPFNAKAAALFPERVRGDVCMILTAHTDWTAEHPRPTIGIARAKQIEDFWDHGYWDEWHKNLASHALPDVKRADDDHIEVGAVPVLTPHGWLIIYSHIQWYYDERRRLFGIEALLLDKDDPQKILGRTKGPIMVPEEFYEEYGLVPRVVFPSGAHLRDDGFLDIYYGAADTSCNRATVKLEDLLKNMRSETRLTLFSRAHTEPILKAIPEHPWEAKWVFNPAAVDLDGSVHMIYRAMSNDNTSSFGYARLKDAMNIDERLSEPMYVPREPFEQKRRPPDGYSGCEDARVTVVDDTLYMLYTAYDGEHPPRVALSSISVSDFLARKWDAWKKPILVTPENVDDKNMCILPERVDGEYLLMHRIDKRICADIVGDLSFSEGRIKRCIEIMGPRPGMWDSEKIGITAPPLRIPEGWLLIYHGVSKTRTYRFGAVLLDVHNPTNVLARTVDPIFEPTLPWEKEGQIPNVVFSCGAVIRDDTLYVYYAGADSAIGVATGSLTDIVNMLLPKPQYE
jgi:predicted GH43/DUF377 family glycosyl hydrolase